MQTNVCELFLCVLFCLFLTTDSVTDCDRSLFTDHIIFKVVLSVAPARPPCSTSSIISKPNQTLSKSLRTRSASSVVSPHQEMEGDDGTSSLANQQAWLCWVRDKWGTSWYFAAAPSSRLWLAQHCYPVIERQVVMLCAITTLKANIMQKWPRSTSGCRPETSAGNCPTGGLVHVEGAESASRFQKFFSQFTLNCIGLSEICFLIKLENLHLFFIFLADQLWHITLRHNRHSHILSYPGWNS